MAKRMVRAQLDNIDSRLGLPAVRMLAANDRMNQLLIEHLDAAAWTAKPPGKVRPIVAIFTHMHNVRCKWIRLTAPHSKFQPSSTGHTAPCSRRSRDWRRAPPGAQRC